MRGKSWTPESRIEIEESRRRVEFWREDTQPVREEIVLVVPKDIFALLCFGLVGWDKWGGLLLFAEAASGGFSANQGNRRLRRILVKCIRIGWVEFIYTFYRSFIIAFCVL